MSPPPSTLSPVLCGKCSKSVASRYQDIRCDLCNQFFHGKCSISFNEFSSSSGWSCRACISSSFPFSDTEDSEFLGLFSENQCNSLVLAVNKKCGNCCKKIKKHFPANFCSGCSDFFHIKCSKVDKNDTQNDWLCKKCTLAYLPFASIDNNSMLLTLKGIDSEGFSENIPSFSIQSLLDKLPGQTFSTDEFLS